MLKIGYSSVITNNIYAKFNLGLIKPSEDKYFTNFTQCQILLKMGIKWQLL